MGRKGSIGFSAETLYAGGTLRKNQSDPGNRLSIPPCSQIDQNDSIRKILTRADPFTHILTEKIHHVSI